MFHTSRVLRRCRLVDYVSLGAPAQLLSAPRMVRVLRQLVATLTELVQGPNHAAQLYLVRCTHAVSAAQALLAVVHSGGETAQVTAREDMRVHVRGDDGVVSRCAATLANCHVPFVLGSTSFTRRELAAELHGCVLQLLVAVVQGANEGALVRRFVAHLNLATLRDGLRAQFSAAHTQYVAGLSC